MKFEFIYVIRNFRVSIVDGPFLNIILNITNSSLSTTCCKTWLISKLRVLNKRGLIIHHAEGLANG